MLTKYFGVRYFRQVSGLNTAHILRDAVRLICNLFFASGKLRKLTGSLTPVSTEIELLR